MRTRACSAMRMALAAIRQRQAQFRSLHKQEIVTMKAVLETLVGHSEPTDAVRYEVVRIVCPEHSRTAAAQRPLQEI